jgi:Flp pilus assembly pilin Flp
MNLIRRCLARGFFADEEAAISSEHALLLTLIAVAIMGALTTFKNAVINNLYTASINMLPFGS